MNRDALVVGVSTYQHLSSLNAPAQDAEAIAHLLETQGDFRVTRLPEIVQNEQLRIGVKTPVSLATLEAALVQLFKPKGSNIPHTALFYFSGHGLQKDAGISEGYLATSDVNPAAHFYGLSLFWLRRLLQESPVRQRIILLDCCHSGEILNYLEADPGAKTGTDRLFMAASREYETAYESLTGQYSVFTQAVLEGLDPRRLPNGVITNYALTDWVSNALKGESQQPLFENSGSEIILTRCQNPHAVLSCGMTADICPYRGLQPFDEEHADYFFGREELTDQLVDRLRTGNFVAVVGASGSGKSSLVKAGLIHKLRRGQSLSGSDRWQIRCITPTDNPFRSLANAFLTGSSAVERAEQLRRAEVFLQGGTAGLTQLIRASLIAENKSTRFLLIIDQFEEIFTLCQGENAERDRHRFFQSLLTAARTLDGQFSLVLVLRADFFSKCSFYSGLAEHLTQHLITVTPLTYDQIKASILKPAEKVGLVCEPNLVYNILLDIVGAPGELPLLQYTLMELWQRRHYPVQGGAAHLTLDAYTELGGVRGTLQKRANEIFYSLSLEEQQIARRIFIALTHLGEGTEDTRRRVLKSELIHAQRSSGLVEQVLEKLVIAKLVVTNQVTATSTYQDQVDQRFANVSTALRLAQVKRQKIPRSPVPERAGEPPAAAIAPAALSSAYGANIARLSHMNDFSWVQSVGQVTQETVDIAHEALIRNWALLRSWLDENREMLRRQRQIERAAREWEAVEPARSPEYVLRGTRLLDAEDFCQQYAAELSPLAHRYIAVSQEANRRIRRDLRLLQVTVPLTLLMALGITFSQYRTAMQNQVEKNLQLRVATSRQWSAIAQSLAQEPHHDPTTALLISRMAAEQGQTYESESSLRAALQDLRLQTHWQVSQQPVQSLAFSPDQHWMATLDRAGILRLVSLKPAAGVRELSRTMRAGETGGESLGRSQPATLFTFNRDGRFLIVHAPGTPVQVWSVERGELQHELAAGTAATSAVSVLPDADHLVLAQGQQIQVWDIPTGQLVRQGRVNWGVRHLQVSRDGQQFLVSDGRMVARVRARDYRVEKLIQPTIAALAVQWSPDQRWVAIANHRGEIQVWDGTTGKLITQTAAFEQTDATPRSPMAQLVISPDGTVVASVNGLGQIQVLVVEAKAQWAIADGWRDRQTMDLPPIAIAFSPDSQHLAITQTQTADQPPTTVSLRAARNGTEMSNLRGLMDAIQTLQFSPDGAMLATGTVTGGLQLWRLSQGGEVAAFQLPQTAIQWAAFQRVAAVPRGTQADPAPAQTALPLSAPQGSTPIAVPPIANTMMTGHTVVEAPAPDAATQMAQWVSERLWLVGQDGAWRQWELMQLSPAAIAALTPKPPVPKPKLSLNNAVQPGQWFQWWQRARAWVVPSDVSASSKGLESRSPAGRLVSAEASEAGVVPSVVVGDVVQQNALNTRLTAAATNPAGTVMAIATQTGGVELWAIAAATPQRLLQLHLAPPSQSPTPVTPLRIHHLAFSPDGQMVAGVGVDKTVRLWRVSGELMHQLAGHEALVDQASFSPDGNRLITASWDRTARLWDVRSGQLLQTLAQPDVVTSARFSPDNQRVLLTSLDGTARVLEVATQTVQVILAGHRSAVLDGDFSPDGRLVVTASTDGTARLWDAMTGVERATLRVKSPDRPSEAVNRAFFSPDGRYVATLNSQGMVHLWVATWEELLRLSRDRSVRTLTPDECLRYLRLAPHACPSPNR